SRSSAFTELAPGLLMASVIVVMRSPLPLVSLPADQPLAQALRKRWPDGFHRELLDQFRHEGLDQQRLCPLALKPAAAQIEKGALIQLAGRRPMGTLHVVREDLQFRLAVDLGLVREQQGLVEHAAVRLLGFPLHRDAPLEDRAGAVIESALVGLLGKGVGPNVADHARRVAVLAATQEVGAIELEFGVLARQFDANLMPREKRAGGEGQAAVARRALQLHIAASKVDRFGARILKAQMNKAGIFLQMQIRNQVDQRVAIAHTLVVLDEVGLRSASHPDHEAEVAFHRLAAAAANKDQLYGLLQQRPRRDKQGSPLIEEGGIERPQRELPRS